MIALTLSLALFAQAPEPEGPAIKPAVEAAMEAAAEAARTSTAGLSPDELRRRRENAEVIRLAEEQDLAAAQEGRSDQDLSSLLGALVKMFIVLAIVCLLAYLLLGKVLPKLLRVPMPTGSKRLLTVVDRLPLDQRRTILVIAVGDEYFLVGAADNGINLISRLEDEAVQAALAKAPPSSAGRLSALRRSKDKEG